MKTHFSSRLGLIVSVCSPSKNSPEKKEREKDCHPFSPLESGGDSVWWIVYKTIVIIHKCNRD